MNRVLISGANGFIGRQVLGLLQAKREYEIHALTYTDAFFRGENLHLYKLDLLDNSAVGKLCQRIKPDSLFHFAWMTKPGEYWQSPENERWFDASCHLLREFQKRGGQRVVVAGTCAEYDADATGPKVEGETPLMPISAYGQAKRAFHRYFDDFCRKKSLSGAWGHIFFTFGPHENAQRLIPSAICALLQKKIFRCRSAGSQMDFLYVKDVADAFIHLFSADIEGAVNIASGESIVLRDILQQLANLMHAEDCLLLPEGEGHEQRPAICVGDTHRLNHEVGWRPHFTLENALKETIQWWKVTRFGERHEIRH